MLSDPFDPRRFQLAQDYSTLVGGTKDLTRVPVGRPDKQVWLRVHPDLDHMIDVAVLDVKSDGDIYLVDPTLALALPNEVAAKRLFQYVTRQGDVGIWPVKLPDSEGKLDPWSESALVAVEKAKKRWVRVVSNRRLGCYEVMLSSADLGEPNFGTLSLRDLLEIAFRGRVIDSAEHPVLRRLRGEV